MQQIHKCALPLLPLNKGNNIFYRQTKDTNL